MKTPLITQNDYLNVAQKFTHARAEHYRVWFTGSTARHKRTEVMLPRLVRKGRLVAFVHEGRLLYIARKHCRGSHYLDLIEHGLGCTEGLVRFWRSDMTGYIISEGEFRGLGSVPEWGILYPHSLLLFEFCTLDNYQRRKVEAKVAQYRLHLGDIENRFNRRAVVVFVIDTPRFTAKLVSMKFVEEPFYFTDYDAFKSVPVGYQLSTPIYFWTDGNPYELRYGLEDL